MENMTGGEQEGELDGGEAYKQGASARAPPRSRSLDRDYLIDDVPPVLFPPS